MFILGSRLEWKAIDRFLVVLSINAAV